MNRFFTITALAVASLALFAACGADVPGSDTDGKGLFVGQITIGPECPVEPCDTPVGAIYMGRDLTFLRSGASPFKVALGTDGSFSVQLDPAEYIIGMDNCNFFGCDVFPLTRTLVAGEAVELNLDFDTGIRTPSQASGFDTLVADFIMQGLATAVGGPIEQPFFAVPGTEVGFGRDNIQVFAYASAADAQAEADLVDPSGSPIGTSMVSWIAPPYFYLRDNFIVIYVGQNNDLVNQIAAVMGAPFAGATPVAHTQVDETGGNDGDPQATIEAFIAGLHDLNLALIEFGNPDGSGGSVTQVKEIAADLVDYTPFFADLGARGTASLREFYGEQIGEVLLSITENALRARQITGDQSIGEALILIPGFAPTGSTSTRTEPLILD